MKRTLTLNREALAPLTGDELATIHGGIPTFGGPVCFVLNTSQHHCGTVLECIFDPAF